MMTHQALALAFAVALLTLGVPDAAFAQTKNTWGDPVDLKPLVIPPVRPFLPPNSVLTPGPALGSQSVTPLNDPTRDQATPGLRLTIPTR